MTCTVYNDYVQVYIDIPYTHASKVGGGGGTHCEFILPLVDPLDNLVQ